MMISCRFMWCCQTTSSKILPNHIPTHTNNNLIIISSFKISANNLSFINPKIYHHFRWPWSSSPSFSPRVAFLPHSLGKHHPSPPGWGSHCPGPTNSWPPAVRSKIPHGSRGEAVKMISCFIHTPKQKSNLIRDTGYRNGQSWKVIKDLHFHLWPMHHV